MQQDKVQNIIKISKKLRLQLSGNNNSQIVNYKLV